MAEQSDVLMLNDPQRKRVWEGLILAEMRQNYFADLGGMYEKLRRFWSWTSLLLSSSAVATLVAKNGTAGFVLVLLATMVSLYNLIARNDRRSMEATELYFRWSRLALEYQELWENMYIPDAQARLSELEQKSCELGRQAIAFPVLNKKLRKWQDHVQRTHATEGSTSTA